MINRKQAKLFCKEDISLIENYEQAKKDLIQTWHLHHRKEEEGYSRKELIDLGMYYDRPANELIFLTKSQHMSLHRKGKKWSEQIKRKMSEARKGNKGTWYGKTGEKFPRSKPVNQIDKQTGQVIKTWPCTMEVQRVLGIANPNISACCSGKIKSCGGYIWRYAV